MTPETKVVLGRVFTRIRHDLWNCSTRHGLLQLREYTSAWGAALYVTRGFTEYESARGEGPTEADAILALQSQLRKMAELEVK